MGNLICFSYKADRSICEKIKRKVENYRKSSPTEVIPVYVVPVVVHQVKHRVLTKPSKAGQRPTSEVTLRDILSEVEHTFSSIEYFSILFQ